MTSPSPSTETLIRQAFAILPPLKWANAELTAILDGQVTLVFPVQDHLCASGTGAVIAGVTATIADMAAGFALLTKLDPPRPITTTSINLHQFAPAKGELIVCTAEVVKVGRAQGLARTEVYAEQGPQRHHAATLIATFNYAESANR
jgi:uncharacterized protein (TIGR00369 family)